jgi:hypothetical protein
MAHYLTLVPHYPQIDHCPQQPQGPKNCEPRRNKEIRQTTMYGIFNRNIQHLPYLIICSVYFLAT